MEIYAFGSAVRGEIDKYSDIDLLILKDKNEVLAEIDKEQFSIYTYHRVSELWKEGNPFAWHLFIESKCIYTTEKIPFLESLGKPSVYKNLLIDLDKFHQLYISSKHSILLENYSMDFDLSMIFLSIRNFASCFALGYLNKYEFSRDSALKLNQYSIQISNFVYEKLKKSRLLATRGIGKQTSENELNLIVDEFPEIEKWFNKLLILSK